MRRGGMSTVFYLFNVKSYSDKIHFHKKTDVNFCFCYLRNKAYSSLPLTVALQTPLSVGVNSDSAVYKRKHSLISLIHLG